MNDNDRNYIAHLDEPETSIRDVDTGQEESQDWQELTENRETAEKNEQSSWLKQDEIDALRARWQSIQIEFVDDPHASVRQADELVGEALERLEQAIANQRNTLREHWSNQEDVSTEDYRTALQRYRSILNQLTAQ